MCNRCMDNTHEAGSFFEFIGMTLIVLGVPVALIWAATWYFGSH